MEANRTNRKKLTNKVPNQVSFEQGDSKRRIRKISNLRTSNKKRHFKERNTSNGKERYQKNLSDEVDRKIGAAKTYKCIEIQYVAANYGGRQRRR